MTRTVAVWILATLLGVPVVAQQAKPKFEVASVKPQGAPVTPGPVQQVKPGGIFAASQATVRDLLTFAYGVRDDQIVGGPDWVREDRFAIDARANPDASADDIKIMVRSLLEDRFKLVSRIGPRDMRYQALVFSRPDGALGPGLIRMDDTCTSGRVNELRRKFPEKYQTPVGNLSAGCSAPGGKRFAEYLTFRLGTPVFDATGLQGSYYWMITSQWPALPGVLRERSDPSLPELPTALKEQLGLKLESRRGPIDVLVIDSVQPPTEN